MTNTSSAARWLLAALALASLAVPLGATWSIVVVDRRTGEVCVASATCLPGFDISQGVPVIVVGKGGGVSQAVLDTSGANRKLIFEGLMDGRAPEAILDEIRERTRTAQVGIVDFAHEPVSFTPRSAGEAKKSVTGEVGDLVYAVQGNVLAGRAVVDACVAALRESEGDLGQRVMAAMEAARAFGGDGRCSCGEMDPTGCGSPPEDFRKSAHVASLLLARIGDTDGTCTAADGCANGDYWLRLLVTGGPAAPDPVLRLANRYDDWRAARAGRPDGILSRSHTVDSLPADGVTTRTVRVQLVDLEGAPLAHGGATVQVDGADGAPTLCAIGPVTDHGDGTYSFALRAGTRSGTDRLVILASDGLVRATLHPFLEVRADPAAVLHVGHDRISAGAGEDVPFVVNEPARPRAKFWLLASLSGAQDEESRVPDRASGRSFAIGAGMPFFPGPPGQLDGDGRAEVSLRVESGALVALVGLRVEWQAAIFSRGPMSLSNTVGFDIGP